MKTTRSMLLCCFGIALGFGFGAGLNMHDPTAAVQAESLTAGESEKIYRELDASSSSLRQQQSPVENRARRDARRRSHQQLPENSDAWPR
jgi:hypothetical protein